MCIDSDFLSDSTEKKRERFISISESARYKMTFKILSFKSNEIIYFSNARPTHSPLEKNIHLESLIILAIIKSK